MFIQWILLMLIILVGGFAWILFLFRCGLVGAVKSFRENNALEAKHAKTSEELGIIPMSTLERMYKSPDYRPYAIKFFITQKIVKLTNNDKLYLSEEALATYYNKSKAMKLVLPRPKEEG